MVGSAPQASSVPGDEVYQVLDLLGIGPRRVRRTAERNGQEGNANWHVWTSVHERCVLRRYHSGATSEDIGYEHRVLRFLAADGWAVPAPLDDPLTYGGRWYCLTTFVGGRARSQESLSQRRQRGRDLADLEAALRPLSETIGQRPRFRPQHEAIPAYTELDWPAGIHALVAESPRLAVWAEQARDAMTDELRRIGASELPSTLIHGDFAEWNVHYGGGRLTGVIDFGNTHLDSRPYELAIARTYRAPEMRDGYRERLEQLGWPLSELEEAAIDPVHRAFRVDMTAWLLEDGRRDGRFDTEMIVRQLERTGVDRP